MPKKAEAEALPRKGWTNAMTEMTRYSSRGGLLARTAVLQLCAALAGFLLARTPVVGGFAPFGIAAAAGMPPNFALASALGAMGGYLFPVSGGAPLRYIAAVFITAAMKWLLSGIFQIKRTGLFSAATAFLAAAVTAAAAALAGGTDGQALLIYLTETLMAMGGAYFISGAIPLLGSGRNLASFSLQETTSAVISICIALMSLSVFEIGSVSPARALTVVGILAAARYGRQSTGAIAGIVAGFAMSLTGNDLLFLVGAYGMGGLLAGVFSQSGRAGSAAAFILANAAMLIRAGSVDLILAELIEVSIATLLFMVLPSTLNAYLADFLSPAPRLPKLDGLRKTVTMKLEFASEALADVSQTVEEVAERLEQINTPTMEQMLSRVEHSACRSCGLRVYCWETSRDETVNGIMEMTKTVREKGRLRGDDLPELLKGRCSRPDSLAESVFTQFTDYTSRMAAEQRLCEVRSVVSDQFDGISQMLDDMAEEMANATYYDTECADRMNAALRTRGIAATDISCCVDQFGRMTAEARIKGIPKGKINRAELMRELSLACEREFDIPCLTEAEGCVLLTLSEKANLQLETGCCQFSCGDNRMCGDAYDYFNDGKGRDILMISDGMGSGGRAAVDSAMASGLMARLIKAGFGFGCSLKIVNSAMLFKSSDESLATVDIACMDLFTGRVDFYKAGAPESFVRRGGKVGRASCSSLPAGILRDVGFDQTSVTLSAGDLIVLVSDGVTTEGTDWIVSELEGFKNGTAQQLAERIANGARRRRSDGREDDVTVMAAIVQEAL